MNKQPDLFEKLKDSILSVDPVYFCQKFLTLEGKPFNLINNGYKCFTDIYRYIGLKALEKDSKPVVLVKGRQVGATTMCSALEMYFMGSGLFGVQGKPPIRIIHAFPKLELAYAYTKTKLNPMITGSVVIDNSNVRAKPKSYMQTLLDKDSQSNDSLQFKQFQGGNHLWIESTGVNADRLRGRQLALDTELPTPNGFVKLIDLKEGDELFDENGNICKITKLHPINYSPEAYELTFDDGTIVEACSDHLWLTYTEYDRNNLRKLRNKKISDIVNKPSIKNTKEILNTLHIKNKNIAQHSIPTCKPINYPKKELLIDPYLFGLWLGDGDSSSGRIETADPEIFSYIENIEYRVSKSSIGKIDKGKNAFSDKPSKSSNYRIVGLTTALKKIGLIKNKTNNIKFIPEDYMHGSFEQRLALLQGLMDTDGCATKTKKCEFTQVNKEISYQVLELIKSLGIKATIKKGESWRYDVRYQDKYTIQFVTTLNVFKLKRKILNLKINNKAITRTTHRFIRSIKPIESKPMRCLTVDSPSHLFLITRSFIPTHNTADIILFDEVQDMFGEALLNATKILAKASYGKPGDGVQVYFGTPKQKGSTYYQIWNNSSQQYYYLGCIGCEKHFPLYTPGSDDWEQTWLYEYIVRCPHCGLEQDKRLSTEKGKWVATRDPAECDFVGFHINQLYNPEFTKEKILKDKPGNNPFASERGYQNEVLGEFYSGEAGIITIEEIREKCADHGRKMAASLGPDETQGNFLGLDWGGRANMEQYVDSEKIKVQRTVIYSSSCFICRWPRKVLGTICY